MDKIVYLNKDAIWDIAAQDFKRKDVKVPQWGNVTVQVRELSAAELEQVSVAMAGASLDSAADLHKAMDYIYDVVIWCLEDGNKQPVFVKADKPELRKKAKTATFLNGLQVISSAAMEMSGLGGDDEEDAGPN